MPPAPTSRSNRYRDARASVNSSGIPRMAQQCTSLRRRILDLTAYTGLTVTKGASVAFPYQKLLQYERLSMRNGELDEEIHLIERLRKVEVLFARSTYPGERQAAESALERIRQRLADLQKVEQPVEFRFSLPDGWSKSL